MFLNLSNTYNILKVTAYQLCCDFQHGQTDPMSLQFKLTRKRAKLCLLLFQIQPGNIAKIEFENFELHWKTFQARLSRLIFTVEMVDFNFMKRKQSNEWLDTTFSRQQIIYYFWLPWSSTSLQVDH